MSDFKRREFLKTTAGVAATTALGSGSVLLPADLAVPSVQVFVS